MRKDAKRALHSRAHRAQRNAKGVSHLGVRLVAAKTQRDQLAQFIGQLADGVMHFAIAGAGYQAQVGRSRPWRWVSQIMDNRERHKPPVAVAAAGEIPAEVEGDPMQPGRQGRFMPEPAERLKEAHKRQLGNFVGDRRVLNVEHRDPVHTGTMQGHELLERLILASCGAGDQMLLKVVHRDHCDG